MYAIVKYAHVTCAVLTICGFLLRGYWMIIASEHLHHRIARIAPHVVDTILLLSGISMLTLLAMNPFRQPWLVAKFAGLAAYIVLGMIALRRGRTRTVRVTAFFAAVAVFAYMAGVAIMHSPASWLKS